jgi:hypothetical protein
MVSIDVVGPGSGLFDFKPILRFGYLVSMTANDIKRALLSYLFITLPIVCRPFDLNRWIYYSADSELM